MSTFREFQTGFTLGQQQQNQRKLQTARADASALFDSGDYSGSESTLMKAGDMDGASAFAEAGARRVQKEQRDAYGNAYRNGGNQGVLDAASKAGDYDTASKMQTQISAMTKEQREAGVVSANWYAQTANGLLQIKDHAQRQAAFQQIVASTGEAAGITPEQAANFDVTNDQALEGIIASSMKLADQLKAQQDEFSGETARMNANENIRNNNLTDKRGWAAIENDRVKAANSALAATGKPTPMQAAVDKNWADDLVNWQINGAANFGKQMAQLDGAVKRLKGGEELTGPGTTFLPGPMRDWFGQAGKDVQQQIQETMQSSLKEVLGGQFAQKEGEGILARVFDPTLEEGVNAQRAERLMTQLKLAADQKNKALEYYNQNGTMTGYQGKVPSEEDFVAAMNFAPQGADYVVAPNGKQFSRKEADAVRSFMSQLPRNMQDPGFISQLEAALGGNTPDAQAQGGASGVPREAADDLMRDPSPAAMAEFNDVFGPGAAERVLNGSR